MNATVTSRIGFSSDAPAPRWLAAGSGQGPRRLAVVLRALLRFAPAGMAALRPAHAEADTERDRLLASALLQSLIQP